MTMRAVLVDDEPLARERLRQLLADHRDVDIVGEAEDVEQALRVVRAAHPDVILLDVRMPGANGFALAERLHLRPAPLIILVTAHADHAVQAFDCAVIDYLLKPFDEARLARALDRTREALAARGGRTAAEPFAVIVGARTVYVPVEDVDWIEGNGNYAKLHVGPAVHLVRITLAALEHRLDPARFVRVHRCTIVALDRIRELQMVGGTEYRLLLSTGAVVRVSPGYRSRLP